MPNKEQRADANPFRAERLKRQATANPFRAERERRASAPTANFVAREMAARGVVNNVLAVPSASGDLLAGAAAAMRKVPELVTPGLREMRELTGTGRSFGDLYAAEKEKFPASALRAIPRVTANEIEAAAKSIPSLVPGGETPRDAFRRNLDTVEQRELAMREAHPIAATAGDIVADVATLMVGRPGRQIRRFETKLTERGGAAAAETFAGDINKVLTSGPLKTLARGAGRSVESGAEAAVLDILHDENADPLETAALAAGGQLIGSGFLSGAQGLLSGGPTKAGLKLSLAAASAFGMLQVMKSATPGGRDRVLESIESGYDKVALALGLGAAAAAVGATRYGRGNAALSEQTRAFLDGIATTHRGTTLSLLASWTEGDEKDRQLIERTLTALSRNPAYSGKTPDERRIVKQIKEGVPAESEPKYRTEGSF